MLGLPETRTMTKRKYEHNTVSPKVVESVPRAQDRIAFVIETIAHLSDHPTIRQYTRWLLVGANLCRMATEEQLERAMKQAGIPRR